MLLLAFVMVQSILFAQQTVAETSADKKVEMADGLRSSGKIYVVVAVLLTVLIGLFLYLVRLDKRISKLENK